MSDMTYSWWHDSFLHAHIAPDQSLVVPTAGAVVNVFMYIHMQGGEDS